MNGLHLRHATAVMERLAIALDQDRCDVRVTLVPGQPLPPPSLLDDEALAETVIRVAGALCAYRALCSRADTPTTAEIDQVIATLRRDPSATPTLRAVQFARRMTSVLAEGAATAITPRDEADDQSPSTSGGR
jgi:hypothetical protein